MSRGDDRDGPDSAGVRVLSAVFAVVSIVAANLADGLPRTPLAWFALVIQGLAAAVLAPGLAALLLRQWGALRDWLREHAPLRVVLLLALVSVLAAGAGLVGPELVAAGWGRVRSCPHATEIRVLTVPENLEPTRELADRYERWTASQDYGCPSSNLHVYAAPPEQARAGLKSGWSGEYLRDIGPRPDLWLPGSSLELAELPAFAQDPAAPLTLAENRSIALSPIVLGVSAAAPGTLLDRRTDERWSALVTDVRAIGWGLARPDPESSIAGRLGTIALYASLGNTQARALEQLIGRSLDKGGYPIDGAAALLCHYRAGPGTPTTLVLPEQALIRFNQGRMCTANGAPARSEALIALYPSDTLSLDHPFVRIAWKRAGAEPAGATGFGTWLGTGPGRQALLAIGLRPAGAVASEPVGEGSGVLPGAVFSRRPPASALVASVDRAYAAAHRPGRVLLALDVSGSMRQPAAGRAGTRFAVASKAVEQSLATMGGTDEFGLWAFPAGSRGPAVRPLAPLARGAPARTAAVAALRRARPAGSTPLFDTIAAGVAAVGPTSLERITALVVLTDGEDNASRLTRAQLVATVRAKEVRVFVIAVGDARCSAQALVEVTGGSGGACYDTTLHSLDERLASLFGALWAGPNHAG
jgi:Ca-activated chloride channel homolog